MYSAEIAKRWTDFFRKNDHHIAAPVSLVSPDPSLLFTIAGVVPFVPYVLGREKAPWLRVASVQKCIRTNDIEEVGKTARHGTFFQMMGNFSFGDYFKQGAMTFAWDLLTGSQASGGYGLDGDRLWVTIWDEDSEALATLIKLGLDQAHIVKLPRKQIFWDTGQPGPAGPCAEWHYDRGPAFGPDAVGGTVDPGGDRYMEIWNLVFDQYVRGEGVGKDYPLLRELDAKAIDTGAGLERFALILQGVNNFYETDLVYPLIKRAEELSSRRYQQDPQADTHFRIVADHTRSALMLIGDGVRPSNEGRGYVLRRVIRRLVRSMRLLGVEDRVLPELMPVARDLMATMYPNVATDFDRISQEACAEEDAFRRTLAAGTVILDAAVAKAASGQAISGSEAFTLHDTYGFPIDLTLEIAAEKGVTVDEAGFRELMAEQKRRARADALAKKTGNGDPEVYSNVAGTLASPVEFVGYTDLSADVALLAVVHDNVAVPALSAPAYADVIIDRTPFYAEAGGQLADFGTIVFPGGGVFEVSDVQRPVPGVIVHHGKLVEGTIAVGEKGYAAIDTERRTQIARAHTATHMVHKALHEFLGEQATQAGSENSPSRLRFDFRHGQGIPLGVLSDIEGRVNERLAENLTVSDQVMDLDAAKAVGAMALFGEKYGRIVRVVSIGGDWSIELCGGTHVANTGNLGLVTVLGEGSIGSGVRRIDALVGQGAWGHQARERALLSQLSQLVGARPDELPDRISNLLGKLKSAETHIAALNREVLQTRAREVMTAVQPCGKYEVVVYDGDQLPDSDAARLLAAGIRDQFGERAGIALVAGTVGGRGIIAVATSSAARQLGAKAGELVRRGATVLGGGGGGRDDVAQGGGPNGDMTGEALAEIVRTLETS